MKKKNNKIKLILLEGDSDRIFFTAFKNKFARDLFDVALLKARNTNYKKINNEIDLALHTANYKAVWLVIDLKTQKLGQSRHYQTKKELHEDYKKQLDDYDVSNMVIIVQDLEAWLLLYYDQYKNTETVNDAEKEIRRLMDCRITSKPQITQRLIKKPDFWDKLIKNKSKNKSFNDFIKRIQKLAPEAFV